MQKKRLITYVQRRPVRQRSEPTSHKKSESNKIILSSKAILYIVGELRKSLDSDLLPVWL